MILLPKDYYNYIHSSQWQQVRQRFYASKMYKAMQMKGHYICYCCRKDNVPLELHHKTYKRLGEEHLNDLVPVCRQCHQEIHDMVDKNDGKGLWGFTNCLRRKYSKITKKLDKQEKKTNKEMRKILKIN